MISYFYALGHNIKQHIYGMWELVLHKKKLYPGADLGFSRGGGGGGIFRKNSKILTTFFFFRSTKALFCPYFG